MPSSRKPNPAPFRPAVIIWNKERQEWLADALWRMRFGYNGWSWDDVTKYMNYRSMQSRQRPIFVVTKVKSYAAANESTLEKLVPDIEATEKCCALDGSYREPEGRIQASHILRAKQNQERQHHQLQQQQQQQRQNQQQQAQQQHQYEAPQERHQRKQQIWQQLRIQTGQQSGQGQHIQQAPQRQQVGQKAQPRQRIQGEAR